MEKFYIVKEGSRLHTDYWEWRNSVSENNKIVISFFEQHGIEATRYWISKDQIGIIPTKNDENKFAKQFTKYALEDGLCLFKRNSVIGKAWIKQAADIKIYHKPSPSWYNSVITGRSSSRLFGHKGILYCSYHAERVEMPEDMFQEIKGSDFYKIMEEIEEGNDSK